MSFFKKFLIFVVLFLISTVIIISTDIYHKINKSYDIFSETLKILINNYVFELDPELLIESAINGMLNTLDPYTVFYSDKDKNEIDFLTNSSYVGLGLKITSIDSQLTITEIFEDSDAYKNNLKIGFRILKIDTNYVLNLSDNNLFKYSRGEIESVAKLTLINLEDDTISVDIKRKKIALKSIDYADFIFDSIGYIKLERFDNTTRTELRNVLNEFIYSNKLKKLILDLSDNSGGLLDAAIGVCEFFLPEETLVLEVKNENQNNSYSYKTSSTPILPDIPLIVIINENSASASEVVAGALQDYDRALIVGKKSFGKGLVQNIFNLPYGNFIKITTSKFYIPSGRCIQRLKFAELYNEKLIINHPDTSSFYTKNGRKVFETSGISPDTSFNENFDSIFINKLKNEFIFFKVGINCYKKYRKNDSLKNDIYFNEFKNYLYKQDNIYNEVYNNLIIELKRRKNNNNYKKVINELEKIAKNDLNILINNNKEEIIKYCKLSHLKIFKSPNEYKKIEISYNNNILKSITLLNSEKYNKMLRFN